MNQKFFNIFGGLAPLALYLILQLMTALASIVVLIVLHRDISELTKDTQLLLAASAIAAFLAIIIFGSWYKKISDGFDGFGVKKLLSLKTILFLIVFGISSQLAISAILGIIGSIRPEWFENYNHVMEGLGMGNSIPSIIYVVFLGPVAEELVFRGVTFRYFQKIMPFMWANIVQAALFGFMHMNLVQGLYAFGIGLVFGLLVYKKESIACSILLHMSINLFGCVLSFMEMNMAQQVLTWLMFASIPVFFVGCRYLIYLETKEERIVTPEDRE
ncbi:MAG: CPBP family intramembrane metalloprotease [Lachnospiraceae bacterium]|nr:CPBP family intramembrane metalloprotease [Lachnospiraceae bacterium]